MSVVQKIERDEKSYLEKSGEEVVRVYPVDKYEIPRALKDRSSEYYILKVPLLGQHFGLPRTEPMDWCGRTSASMAFNYFELLKGGDPRSRYITHWNKGQPGWFLDLRHPTGERAFHRYPLDPPFDRKKPGVLVGGDGLEEGYAGEIPVPPKDRFPENGKGPDDRTKKGVRGLLQYKTGFLLPYKTDDRMAQAARIRGSQEEIKARFAPVIDALRRNNPVVFYSGFSENADGPIHVILLIGYAYLRDRSGEEQLWIAVADPATYYDPTIFRPPSGKAGKDVEALAALDGTHDLLRLDNGDWCRGRASLTLVRARKFFEERAAGPHFKEPHLFMDYCSSDDQGNPIYDAWGGCFLYSDRVTDAPDEVIDTNVAAGPCLPYSSPDRVENAVNCFHRNETTPGGYYPLGMFRNIHAGVHLSPPETRDPKDGNYAAVRSLGPGTIVALRMVDALPHDVAGGDRRDGRAANEGAQRAAANHNAFVLVRHTLEEIPPKKEGGKEDRDAPKKRFTFYSLYMHLAPPDWQSPGAYADVRWLDKVVHNHGSVTVIDRAVEGFASRRWARKDNEGEALLTKGPVDVYGRSVAERASLELKSPEAGRLVAVWKAPERDVRQTYEALVQGKVVTFSQPLLVVARGETLGYVERKSRSGAGFLHWEVLSPSGAEGGLLDLLAFAEKSLDLGEGFFKRFKEKTRNNYFDPGGGETKALLDTLPDPAEGEPLLDNDYHGRELEELMKKPAPLTFALGLPAAPRPPKDALVYPARIKIANYLNSLPRGSYQLKFRFDVDHPEQVVAYDGQKPEIHLVVPAGARKIFVEPVGFHLQTSGGRSELADDVAHFKNLASARFRNVAVEYVNEWSLDGLKASLKARLDRDEWVAPGRPERADDEIERYAKAVAWWAHDEQPVQGKGGGEPLFGGGEGKLPERADLDAVHPVTLAWLIHLLVKHNKVRFVEERPSVEEASRAAAFAGWMPARKDQPPAPRLVGEAVDAVVVSKGEIGDDVPVTLQVTKPGWSEPLTVAEGRYREGLFATAVPLSFWGTWTLAVKGEAPAPIGGLSIDIHRPVPRGLPAGDQAGKSHVLDEGFLPPERTEQGYRWAIEFTQNCPRALQGWVILRTQKRRRDDPWKDDGFEIARIGIPIEARREEATAVVKAGFTIDKGFYVKGPPDPNTHVTDNFTYKEYADANGGKAPPKLSVALADAVQAIRREYGGKIRPSNLSPDGLGIDLDAFGADLDKLAAAARTVKTDRGKHKEELIENVAQGKKAVTVTAKAPPPEDDGTGAGRLVASFSPAAAFGALAADLGPDEELGVRLGLLFVNGGVLVEPPREAAHPVEAAAAIDVGALKARANQEYIEVWTSDLAATLSRPSFGKPGWTLAGDSLLVSVDLHGGTPEFWAEAKPGLDLGDGKPVGAVSVLKDRDGRLVKKLSHAIPLGEKGKKLAIKAKVAKKGVLYAGAAVDVKDSDETSYDTTPKLLDLTTAKEPAESPTTLRLSVRTQGFPASRILNVYLSAKDLKDKDAKDLGKKVKYALPYKNGGGFCDEKGVFEATIALEDLHRALKVDRDPRSFQVEVGRRIDPKIVEPVRADVTLDPLPRPEEHAGDGPVQGGMAYESALGGEPW